MKGIKTKLSEGSRIVIPAEYRKKMGLKPGDDVILLLDEDEIRITTLNQSIKSAQELVRKYIPESISLVDELIQERREEAARE